MIQFFICIFICMAALSSPTQAIMFLLLALFVSWGDRVLTRKHQEFLKHPRSADKPEPTEQLLSKQEAEFSNSHSDFRYWPEKFNSELEI